MSLLRQISKTIVKNQLFPGKGLPVSTRQLNYTPKEYGDKDPAPVFFSQDTQDLLKALTRVDLNKVFKKRKLGTKGLEDPIYKFMTDEQLQQANNEARKNAEELLQIPPVVQVEKPLNRVFSKDPALQGLDTCRFVFTDISFGVKDKDRLVLIREPDGTLKEAEREVKNRVCQVYFPREKRYFQTPLVFKDHYFEDLLKRQEYNFILDFACNQFDPEESEYQRVVTITYQYVNDKRDFELLRSTRHFGALTFFLVWNKMIDNLLLDLIETLHIDEAFKLIQLYSLIHKVEISKKDPLEAVEKFIKDYGLKKASLELAIQSYKDVVKQQNELKQGIKSAHGLS